MKNQQVDLIASLARFAVYLRDVRTKSGQVDALVIDVRFNDGETVNAISLKILKTVICNESERVELARSGAFNTIAGRVAAYEGRVKVRNMARRHGAPTPVHQRTVDLGNNEQYSEGIFDHGSQGFLAMTATASRWFKTRNGAERYLIRVCPDVAKKVGLI